MVALLLLAACGPADIPLAPDEVRLTVEDVPDLVLAKVLTVESGGALAVRVTCTRDGHEAEVHVLTDSTSGTEHVLHLRGLLADTTYRCEVFDLDAPEESRAGAMFTTDVLPDEIPEVTVARAETTAAEMDGVWTLTSHTRGESDPAIKLLVFDPDGDVRWYHLLGVPAAGDLDQQLVGDTVLFGGGYEVPPTRIDLDGNQLWQAPDIGGTCNHHVEWLPDGQVLYITTETDEADARTWMGYRIIVMDPATNAITWSWSTQSAVDAGDLSPPTSSTSDPHHMNWVGLGEDEDGPYALASFRKINDILRIDRDTGAVTWHMGPEQTDFTLIAQDGGAPDPVDWFYGQHAPEPHADHLYVYDNGTASPIGNSTRVMRYTVDWAARTLMKAWSYTEPGWYEPIWGDVDELPGGHVLITHAHCSYCEASHDQRSSILEVDPTDDTVIWRLEFATDVDGTYRSERIAGCDLFADAEYCPSLLDP